MINQRSMNTHDKTNITGLILAGGRGSRMGGVDKGLQLLDGETMITRVLARLQPQVATIIINANRNLANYKALDAPVYPDENSDFNGPLAGIQAGLRHCATSYLVTAPCDSPFLPDDLVTRLFAAIKNDNTDIAVVVTNDENDTQRAQPTFMLLKTNLADDLDRYLQEGGRKIGNWYRRLRYSEVLFENSAAFNNINTVDDMRAASTSTPQLSPSS